MTTIFIEGEKGSHFSSGYPIKRTKNIASTVFLVSSIPPSNFPESV